MTSSDYCEYELHRNPKAAPTGEKYMHARLASRYKWTYTRLLEELSKKRVESDSVLKGVIDDFIGLVHTKLSHGEHVQIEGLGGFQITLDCPPGIKEESDVRGNSIKVKSVQYRPDTKLIKKLKTTVKFRRSPYKKNVNNKLELVKQAVRDYFNDPTNEGNGITSRHIKNALHISQQAASDRLHELVSRKFLMNVSPNIRHPLYTKGIAYSEE